VKAALGEVRSTLEGFSELLRFSHEISASDEPVLDIDMSDVSWLDANMCAPLGALLEPLRDKSWKVAFWHVRPELAEILRRNGFLRRPGLEVPQRVLGHGTTIDYKRFDRTDVQGFKRYIAQYLVGKGIPEMTPALSRKFRESISEIFENAMEHSETKLGVFACGQYYPKKKRLDFSIADRGIGMRANILNRTGLALSDEQATAWSMEGMNTTRRPGDGRPGGLGLKLIRDFVSLNQGSIQIVSYTGYWRFKEESVESRSLSHPFPGTVVNIEINAADTKSYRLALEIDRSDIF
jgi:signal transduction histidine kinase